MPLLIVEGMRENLENGRRGHANQHRSGLEISVRIMIVEGMEQNANHDRRGHVTVCSKMAEGVHRHATHDRRGHEAACYNVALRLGCG